MTAKNENILNTNYQGIQNLISKSNDNLTENPDLFKID